MVVLGAGLNATQAYRSQAAAKRLRERVGQRATVVRDGAARDIPAREVVPGDLVQLAAGDLVPADGALASAKDHFGPSGPSASSPGSGLGVVRHPSQSSTRPPRPGSEGFGVRPPPSRP
jgi:E1-E2 ATPase